MRVGYLAVAAVCVTAISIVGAAMVVSLDAAMIAVLLVASLSPAVYYGIRGRIIEEPIVLVGMSFAFFGALSSMGVAVEGAEGYPYLPLGLAVSTVGLICAYIAYWILRPASQRITTGWPTIGTDLNRKRLYLGIAALLAGGGYALWLRFRMTGMQFFGDDGQLPVVLQTQKLGALNWTIPLLTGPAVALALLYTYAKLWGKRLLYAAWLVGIALYVPLYAALGSRSRLILPLLAFFVHRHLLVKKFTMARVALGFVAILGTYMVFGQVRAGLFSGGSVIESVQQFDPSSYATEHGDTMEFRGTIDVLMDYPEKYGYLLGSTLVTPITQWIPRRVWPSKPDSGAVVYSAQYLPDAWALGQTAPPGLVGEFYMNFGIVGVIVGMFLVGAMASLLAAYRETHAADPGATVIYGLSLLPVATAARGDLAFVGASLELIVLLTLAVLLVAKKRPGKCKLS